MIARPAYAGPRRGSRPDPIPTRQEGDEAFCSYLDGDRDQALLGDNVAVVVVRSRTALITVMFGTEAGDTGLTQDQTVKGAYAVAQKVAARVR